MFPRTHTDTSVVPLSDVSTEASAIMMNGRKGGTGRGGGGGLRGGGDGREDNLEIRRFSAASTEQQSAVIGAQGARGRKGVKVERKGKTKKR